MESGTPGRNTARGDVGGERRGRATAYDATNAFFRGELTSEAAAEPWDPQIEWHWPRRTMPDQPQHLRGIPEVIGYLEQYRSAWADLATEPLEFIEAPGDRVLMCLRQIGRGRESGAPFELHFFQVLMLQDGKVRNVVTLRHRADALEAAGLPE